MVFSHDSRLRFSHQHPPQACSGRLGSGESGFCMCLQYVLVLQSRITRMTPTHKPRTTVFIPIHRSDPSSWTVFDSQPQLGPTEPGRSPGLTMCGASGLAGRAWQCWGACMATSWRAWRTAGNGRKRHPSGMEVKHMHHQTMGSL